MDISATGNSRNARPMAIGSSQMHRMTPFAFLAANSQIRDKHPSQSLPFRAFCCAMAGDARSRQLARLGGEMPPAPRDALAMAKSKAYQAAADAPATLRAYAADLANFFKAWCEANGFQPMLAAPETMGAIWRLPVWVIETCAQPG